MQRETWGYKSSLLTSFNVTVAGFTVFICRARESKKLCFCLWSAVAFFSWCQIFGFQVPLFGKAEFCHKCDNAEHFLVQFLKAVVVIMLFLLIAAETTQ